MAEIVGLVAGAVQFLDVGARVLICLSRLCSDLQHVPRKIKTATRQLNQTLQLVENIKSDVEAPNSGPGTTLTGTISQPQIELAKEILTDAVAQVTELQTALERLSFTGDGVIKRGWRALVAVKKEQEILEKCANIESIKSSLQLWFQQQSLSLIKDDILVDRRIDSKLDDLGQNVHFTEVSIGRAVEHSREEIVQAITEKHMLLKAMDEKMQQMQQMLIQQASQRLVSKPSYFTDVEQHSGGWGLTKPSASKSIWYACSCSARSARLYKSWGNIRMSYDPTRAHEPSCPLYPQSHRSFTIGVRAVMPAIFSRCLDFAFRVDFGSGGFAMCPSIRNAVRIVDRDKSPAFRAVATLKKKFNGPPFQGFKGPEAINDAFEAINDAFEAFKSDLVCAFRNANASAYDQDPEGNTILHDFLCFFVWYQPLLSRVDIDRVNLVRPLIKLLVDFGVDVNADCSPPAFRSQIGRCTALDLAMFDPRYLGISPTARRDLILPLATIVQEFGGEIHGPNRYFDRMGTSRILTLNACHKNSELALQLGVPAYYRPVFDESTSDLRTIIDRKEFEERHEGYPSLLAAALSWPEGRNMLLDAGADPKTAICIAMARCDIDAVRALLNANCPFFGLFSAVESWHRSKEDLLGCARNKPLWLPQSVQDKLVELVLQHLVFLRKTLQNLAATSLPAIGRQREHIELLTQHDILIDEEAQGVYQTLEHIGLSIPPFLWPGAQKSVYHLTSINTGIAERLFGLGFRDVDLEDEKGSRPVELACRRRDLDLAHWYLSHGCPPNPKLVWALARGFRTTGLRSRDGAAPFFSACGHVQADNCRCHCSSSGCLPATIYIRNMKKPWPRMKRRLEIWISCMPCEDRLEAFTEACRLLVFERLGMTHTCCPDWLDHHAFGWNAMGMSLEDQSDIMEEEEEFAWVLEEYMQIFMELRVQFCGRFRVFWDAWWAAMDLILPDSKSNTGSGERLAVPHGSETQRPFHGGPGLENPEFERLGTEQYKVLIHSIIGHYPEVVRSLHRFVALDGDPNIPHSWMKYLEDAGVPRELCQWIANGTGQHNQFSIYEEDSLMPWEYDYSEELDFMLLEYRFIRRTMVPLMTAVVIRNLDLGLDIPADLRQHLIFEGILKNRRLPSPAFKEAPEAIFAQSVGTLFS